MSGAVEGVVIDQIMRTVYEDHPMIVISEALATATGEPMGSGIPYDRFIAMGGRQLGLRRSIEVAINTFAALTTPPARSYADEDVALDAAISAMGWTDKRMVEDARKIAAGFWFETYGFGGDCCLTGSQATSFRSCLDGARAAIRLLSQVGKA